MLKRYTITLDHIITTYINMFHQMDCILQCLAMNKKQRKEFLYGAVKVALQQLSKYYAEDSPMTGLPMILNHNLEPFQKL